MAVKSTKTKLPTHAELTARVNTLRRAHEDLLVRFNTVQHELDDNERDTNAKCSALEGTVTAKLDRAVADTQGRVAQVEGENRHLADLGENLMSRINQVEEQIREVVTLAEQLVKATGEQKDYCQRRTQVEFGKFHGLADKVDEHLTDHAEVIRQSVQNQLELIVDETVKVLEREGWRRPAEGRKSVLEPARKLSDVVRGRTVKVFDGANGREMDGINPPRSVSDRPPPSLLLRTQRRYNYRVIQNNRLRDEVDAARKLHERAMDELQKLVVFLTDNYGGKVMPDEQAVTAAIRLLTEQSREIVHSEKWAKEYKRLRDYLADNFPNAVPSYDTSVSAAIVLLDELQQMQKARRRRLERTVDRQDAERGGV
jgi:hypothetical protein